MHTEQLKSDGKPQGSAPQAMAQGRFTESQTPPAAAYRQEEEHILVCLSSAPSNANIIRTAARMSCAFGSDFTALFVHTPEYDRMSDADRRRLEEHMALARKLGARIETVHGADVPFQIAEYARLNCVSRIVIGRSTATRHHLFGKPSLTDLLISYVPHIDIHIIPDSAESNRSSHAPRSAAVSGFSAADLIKSLFVFGAATGLSIGFYHWGFTESNIILVYILGVLVTSVWTNSRVYSLVPSVASVILFNFLFTQPRYTLLAYDKSYPVTFLVMFLAAFITGTLAVRLKAQAQNAANSAYRTKMLLEMDRLLSQAKTQQEILCATAMQLQKLLGREVTAFLSEGDGLSAPLRFTGDEEAPAAPLSPRELEVAMWVMENNHQAGATTDTFPDAQNLYLAVRVNDRVYGVVGIDMRDGPTEIFESTILLSILGECGLALENEKNAREKDAAAEQAKNERIRANLLRSVSHDLRTPLTSISGNASNLISSGDSFDDATKLQIYTDIYDDAMWLNDLVENLLAISKIEDGHVRLHVTSEVMEDVIAEAMAHVDRRAAQHTIVIRQPEELILAQMDARLVIQVLINLVNNAIKYTPSGSQIIVETTRQDEVVTVRVIDDGEGVLPQDKPFIFNQFFCGSNQTADSCRSLGLGLSLCRSIITALGGTIKVQDNVPHGAIFTFTLPAGEVQLHE